MRCDRSVAATAWPIVAIQDLLKTCQSLALPSTLGIQKSLRERLNLTVILNDHVTEQPVSADTKTRVSADAHQDDLCT
jgi:hypothetical protein